MTVCDVLYKAYSLFEDTTRVYSEGTISASLKIPFVFHCDKTAIVDWALKTSYLSVYCRC